MTFNEPFWIILALATLFSRKCKAYQIYIIREDLPILPNESIRPALLKMPINLKQNFIRGFLRRSASKLFNYYGKRILNLRD
jgi:hypothetical protein